MLSVTPFLIFLPLTKRTNSSAVMEIMKWSGTIDASITYAKLKFIMERIPASRDFTPTMSRSMRNRNENAIVDEAIRIIATTIWTQLTPVRSVRTLLRR